MIQNRIKSLDIYRKLPYDLVEPTVSGAFISILVAFIMAFLFFTEIKGYLQVEEVQEMYVDSKNEEGKLRVNLDIMFPRFPCDIFSLDAQDVMGTHQQNLEGSIIKMRLSRQRSADIDGEVVEVIEHKEESHFHNSENFDYERASKAFSDKEGCHVKGHFFVNKVPGNFHISCHAFSGALNKVFNDNKLTTIDLSHKINHLSFGERTDIQRIQQIFSQGVLTPLNGNIENSQGQRGTAFQYYLNVVPTIYQELNGNSMNVHQFTGNWKQTDTSHLPAAYFRYDISPVTVRFKQQRENFFHFIVQICAIIGGVFTLAGVFDSFVHRSVLHLLKKEEMGKLS